MPPTLMRYEQPFPYLAGTAPEDLAAALDARFDQDAEWVRYDSFYRCWIADVTGDVPIPDGLVSEVAASLGLPLTPRVRVTVQRMGPGDGARVHTDRPLLGYEAVRQIIQLNHDWSAVDGGLFTVHPDADGRETIRVHEPTFGATIRFAMTPDSHHGVSEVTTGRRTAVLHFWHIGNTERLEAYLRDLLGSVSVATLPSCLDAEMVEAEATRPDDATLRAAMVALVLQRWGAKEEALVAGYRAGLRALTDGDRTMLGLARWAAHLWLASFDLAVWDAMSRSARGPLTEEAAAFDRLAFPGRRSSQTGPRSPAQ